MNRVLMAGMSYTSVYQRNGGSSIIWQQLIHGDLVNGVFELDDVAQVWWPQYYIMAQESKAAGKWPLPY